MLWRDPLEIAERADKLVHTGSACPFRPTL